jgi:hypothetical protein
MLMRWLAAVILGVWMLLLPSLAAADSTFVSVGLPVASGPILVPTFNTSLGTLNSVEVTITGEITVEVQTQLVIGPSGTPIPTPFGIGVDQNFGGGSGAPFNFQNPGSFYFTGVGSGLGEVQNLSQYFNYTFQFNQTTDVPGLTSVSSIGPSIPPGIAFGTTSGFASPILPFVNEIVTVLPSSFLPTYGATFLIATEQGDVQIEYDYTPPAPPSNMPEPATLTLLGSGLLALLARRRMRQAA